tara:strand:+ start:261 stop:983 length:723 start_codon:yes stop_codon:yes gene_type:complete
MISFSKPLIDTELYTLHYQITLFMILIWVLICIMGLYISNKKTITLLLICISFFQEIFDYINRFYLNNLYIMDIQKDLPLQLCHFAYWFSVICLISQLYKNKYNQFYFNCAYFLGFSGALQGIITVDLTGIYTSYDMIALHLQHSIIILNLLWLIFAYKIKFNTRGVLQAFIFTNVLVVIVGIINYFLESNYMFLCIPPNVDNPLLIGGWPYYLIILEVIFFVYGYILYLPFKILKYFNK